MKLIIYLIIQFSDATRTRLDNNETLNYKFTISVILVYSTKNHYNSKETQFANIMSGERSF